MIVGGTKQHRNNGGFTIVETLIVLTVTGILAVSFLALISGKQNKVQFQVAINNLQQAIQQVINETASGYFPNSTGFSCSPGAAGNQPTLSTGSATSQGQNDGCIFMGKVIQFGTSANHSQLAVYSLAGNRLSGPNTVSVKLQEANPIAVAPSGANPDYPNLTNSKAMENGLTTYCVAYQGNPCDPTNSIGALGFLPGDSSRNFAGYETNGNLKSGSQQLSMYAIKNTSLNSDPKATAENINYRNLQYVASAQICVVSGTTNQSGLLTITDLNVQLTIKGNTTCS